LRLVTAGLLALAVLVAACRGDDPGTAATAASEDALIEDVAALEPDGRLDGESLWREVVAGLSALERSCIRGSLSEADLEAQLEHVVASDDFPTAAD